MARPLSTDPQLYYRCAVDRHDDALILLKSGKTTGAVYLAGYAVECVLKALILKNVPRGQRMAVFDSFRGKKAHSFDSLRAMYLKEGGHPFPADIKKSFTLVNYWNTELRYNPKRINPNEAGEFLEHVTLILAWARERLT